MYAETLAKNISLLEGSLGGYEMDLDEYRKNF